jgi:hypothetical protein
MMQPLMLSAPDVLLRVADQIGGIKLGSVHCSEYTCRRVALTSAINNA